MPSLRQFAVVLLLFGLLLAGCKSATPTATLPAPGTAQPTPLPGVTSTPQPPTATASPLPPTPTPAPLAARVNGEGLTLADYNSELQRLQQGLKDTGMTMSPEEQRQTVLQDLTDQMLLAQAAVQDGYVLSDADFQKRLTENVAGSGGAQAFTDWLSRNFYTDDSFKVALRRSLAAAWSRDQIIARAPTTAEQVHARQILVLNQDLANRLYAQLQAGTAFTTLSAQVDPDSGGELGWFPRNYLFLPEIESAAFNLQPGQYSPIIKTSYGYHIVYLIERNANRPLDPDARLLAQRQYLKTWLADYRARSKVEILVP